MNHNQTRSLIQPPRSVDERTHSSNSLTQTNLRQGLRATRTDVNQGDARVTEAVTNTGDRPIQVCRRFRACRNDLVLSRAPLVWTLDVEAADTRDCALAEASRYCVRTARALLRRRSEDG
jgi:hypothetical protein